MGKWGADSYPNSEFEELKSSVQRELQVPRDEPQVVRESLEAMKNSLGFRLKLVGSY